MEASGNVEEPRVWGYKDIWMTQMGRTNAIVHEVDGGNTALIKQHPYRLNPFKARQVRREVEAMLGEDIIEPSQSDWSSPIVFVPNPDGTQRFRVDYRKVNAVTKLDSDPVPRLEDCIERVGQASDITKLD
ncbi:uncharacterized protein LOC132834020 [Hemiscyllium ocellatum]|uniref:uncharacterized protein LOC132834020 n=1 Tax=Hemiscyllium ocellatum TaxID=170820 RepID=UPI002966BC35|nr:uncharacterized protein LOC132834020 [Hemiscyllium ocellatum]